MNNKSQLLRAIESEIKVRVRGEEIIETIYLGGGTPSLCSTQEINSLLSELQSVSTFSSDAEITLECNPDDLSLDYLKEIRDVGINRLSIGVQSFYDVDLQFMNRAHNASEAEVCIENALKSGFENITIDLIYGCPTTTNQMWENNVKRALDSGIHHISSYALTVEENTKLNHEVKKGTVLVSDEKAATQFDMLLSHIKNYGFEQYEISNFCKEGKYARHNTSYWQGKKYTGLGPAAHSFDGSRRRWNIANNAQYIKAIESETKYWEEETLTVKDRYNEYIMTGLRTKWGINTTLIEHEFGQEIYNYFLKSMNQSLYKEKLEKDKETIIIKENGKFFADAIAASLFKL